MTRRGRLATLFPAVHLGLAAAGVVRAVQTNNSWWLLASVLAIYLFPPVCFRLHQWVWPLVEGRHNLSEPTYSPWWASLQMQSVFNAAPWLEALLRVIPGAYSAWLRLWGSRVGRSVVWTPRIEIADRSLMKIGDHVVFGHRAAFYPHVVDRRGNGSVTLYVRSIEIGDRAFIGAGSRLAHGVFIAADARLPALTDVSIDKRFEKTP